VVLLHVEAPSGDESVESVRHPHVDQSLDPLGRLLDCKLERVGDMGENRCARGIDVQARASGAEGVGVDKAKDEVGVGDCGHCAAAPEADGPGHRPGAVRADGEPSR